MASKQAFSGKENPGCLDENLSYSSHEGDEYDAASYGSDLEPPGLAQGYTMVHENCCRARYKPSTAPKSSSSHVCLNKSSCRSVYGGKDHSVLRGGHRAEPGVYEGIYSKTGKLLCAKAGTRTTARSIELEAQECLASDRAHASTLTDRVSSPSISSIPAAYDQTSDVEGEVGREITERSEARLSAKDTMFLDLLSSLCQKIDNLSTGSGGDGRDNQKGATTRRNPGILRRPKSTRRTKDDEPVSSVARKHANATRKKTSVGEHEDD